MCRMTFILPDDKAAARKLAAANRLSAHEKMKVAAPLLLASQSFPAVLEPGFQFLSAFFPFRSEIDTRPLMVRLAGDGWTTCLPIIKGAGEPLIFRRWLPGEPLERGAMDIERPADSAPEVEPDVLIVPLLAFDRLGYRLGYGGGYYDRTLSKLRAKKRIIAIGVAYAAQEAESVPHAAHDQPLDYVMTERSVLKCA
jgi:5-formyltetrahydrofolate cyclo-ligase